MTRCAASLCTANNHCFLAGLFEMNIRARNHVCTAAFVVAADTCPSLPLARSLQALWCACRRLGASGVASCTSILLARVSILFTLAMASPTTTIWVTLHYTHLFKLSFLFNLCSSFSNDHFIIHRCGHRIPYQTI